MSLSLLLEPDKRWMKMALAEAQRAFDASEVPVGAIVVRQGQVIGRGRNMVEQLKDPTAHAEMIAVTAACETIGQKYLEGCTLYVTLEPCPMCAGAIVWAKLSRVVFGAFDEKAGGAGTLYNILQDRRLNHQVDLITGVEQDAAAALMRDFFRKKRPVR
jgi:tRNA(adenine34) deaminase